LGEWAGDEKINKQRHCFPPQQVVKWMILRKIPLISKQSVCLLQEKTFRGSWIQTWSLIHILWTLALKQEFVAWGRKTYPTQSTVSIYVRFLPVLN
jgi:hypothetical protein